MSKNISTVATWPLVILWLWLVMILGIGQLNARDLWYDEIYTLYHTGAPPFGPYTLPQVWSLVAQGIEWTPPGYNLLLNVWTHAVGWSPFAARYLSLLASLLTIAWVYRLGVDSGNRFVGLSAAILLGASVFFIYYMGELRAYALYLCLSAQVLASYWRYIHHPNRLSAALFFIGTLALMYTHYFGLLVLVALGIYHLLFAPKGRVWWSVGGIVAIATVFYLPWLNAALLVLREAQKGDWSGGAMSARLAIETLLNAFGNGASGLLVLLMMGAVLVKQRGARFALFMMATVLMAVLLVNTWLLVLNHIRYIFALWVLLALVGAWGVYYWSQAGLRARWLLGVWLAFSAWQYTDADFIFNLHGAFRPLPHRQVVATISPYATSTDLIVYHAPYFPHIRDFEFDYYLSDLPARHALLDPFPGQAEPRAPRRFYERLIGPSQRLWLVIDKTQPPRHYLRDFMRLVEDNFIHCGTMLDTPELRLDLFARLPQQWTLQYQTGIRSTLLGRMTARPRSALGLVLGWRLPPTLPHENYSASIQIYDDVGRMIAQSDYGLPKSEYACQPTRIPLDNLPYGDYSVRLIVYEWRSLERLYAHHFTKQEVSTTPTLGTFIIKPPE